MGIESKNLSTSADESEMTIGDGELKTEPSPFSDCIEHKKLNFWTKLSSQGNKAVLRYRLEIVPTVSKVSDLFF